MFLQPAFLRTLQHSPSVLPVVIISSIIRIFLSATAWLSITRYTPWTLLSRSFPLSVCWALFFLCFSTSSAYGMLKISAHSLNIWYGASGILRGYFQTEFIPRFKQNTFSWTQSVSDGSVSSLTKISSFGML